MIATNEQIYQTLNILINQNLERSQKNPNTSIALSSNDNAKFYISLLSKFSK